MSMKRSKPRGSGSSSRNSGKDDDSGAWGKPAAPEPTWEADVESKPDGSFQPFAMSSRYKQGDLIAHAKFGKGIVLDAEASRIEVLFQDGKKKLGHGVAS